MMEHTHHHRTWFPFILIGLSLLLLLVVLAVLQGQEKISVTNQGEVPQEQVDPVTAEEYESAIVAILSDFSNDQNASSAYDALIETKVPLSHQSVHLELVILMGQWKAGEVEEAQARLDLLRAQYPWLN